MATLLSQATDAWSFDKLIQPLSNPSHLEELLSYLNGKHKSYQHDHIDPIALSRVLIALKFVSSKKKLLSTLKPSIDELINLCHSIINALKNEHKLSKSSPWLWLETMLVFMNKRNDSNNSNTSNTSIHQKQFPYIDIDRLVLNDHSFNTDTNHPQFLFPQWAFATENGIKLFQNKEFDSDFTELFGEDHHIDIADNDQKKSENDTVKMSKPVSRTLSNVKFLSFPRPNIPQKQPQRHKRDRGEFEMEQQFQTRKRPKVATHFSLINDKLNEMMHKKNEKKNCIRLLSIQQKRQMREDSDRREQERKYQMEQTKKEKERIKKLQKEKEMREEKEQLILSGLDQANVENVLDKLDDFDAFMDEDESDGDKDKLKPKSAPLMGNVKKVEKVVLSEEEQRLIGMGIPKPLHKFKWLYEGCNQLKEEERVKIVDFLTGKYLLENEEREDILLHRSSDIEKGITKDNVFRMFFKTKKWKKVTLSRRIKKKT